MRAILFTQTKYGPEIRARSSPKWQKTRAANPITYGEVVSGLEFSSLLISSRKFLLWGSGEPPESLLCSS